MDAGNAHLTSKKWWLIAIGIIVAIILIAALVFLPGQSFSPPALQNPIIIASGSGEYSALTIIADEMGYFKKYGLNVTIMDYDTGVAALNELFSGNADLACAAEFVGVSSGFGPEDFRIIASTAKSDVIALVIRNDRGISKPSDLRGKTVAVPKGTAAEFFLGRYLSLNGIDINDVIVVYMSPAELLESIESKESDAVIIWEPYAYQITQKLGDNVTAWPAQSGQNFYWVTYTRDDVLLKKPETIRNYLRAIDDAENFVYNNRADAEEIIKRRLNLTDDYLESMWGKNQFVLSLDQGLILAMEDQARWMADHNMTGKKAASSYLDMIYQDAMLEVKPQANTIIR
ncbi:MAG: ABC transporter substrate-binding protein [Methanomicrobiaceae archaeon]|nr:ABC transporter substrate-binding protein [Methanomicrobiaceae archaeon]